MPEKSKMRKRLLYDLSPIPEIPVNDGAKGKLEPEVRVVYDNKVLLDLQKVDNKFTLGTEIGADCVVDEAFLSENKFDFASVSGKNFSVNLKSGFKGALYKGTEKTDLEKYIAEGHTSVDIDVTTLIVVEFGTISVCAMKSPAEKYKGGALQFDFAFAIILLLIFIIGGFVFNMIVETPPIEVDIFELDNRFAKLIVETKEEEIKVEEIEEEKKVKLEKPKEGLVEATSQRKSLGEEGRVGDKKSRVANAQGSARRGLDAKVAQSSGIMGALSSGAASFDRVFGGGGLGAGMEKTLGSVQAVSEQEVSVQAAAVTLSESAVSEQEDVAAAVPAENTVWQLVRSAEKVVRIFLRAAVRQSSWVLLTDQSLTHTSEETLRRSDGAMRRNLTRIRNFSEESLSTSSFLQQVL